MGKFRQSIDIYREDGLAVLCRKVIRYVLSYALLPIGKVYTKHIPPLPKLHKRKHMNSVTAKFEISNYTEFLRLVFKKGDTPLEAFLSEIQDEDIVFDVGANIGMYACLAEQAGENITVYAFEPHPANITSLRNNINLNKSDIEVLDFALSNSNGKSEFFAKSTSERGEGIGSISDESHSKEMFTESITIETNRGDDLISKNVVPNPDILKIDVEGAEIEVLAGFEETLANRGCRAILVEVHNPPNSVRDVKEVLEKYDYKVNILSEGEHQTHLIAKF